MYTTKTPDHAGGTPDENLSETQRPNIPSGTDMIFDHAEAEEIVTQEKTKSARKKKAREPTAAPTIPITNRMGRTRTRDIKAALKIKRTLGTSFPEQVICKNVTCIYYTERYSDVMSFWAFMYD